MINCFWGIVDRRKVFSLISSQEHCQRSSPSLISDTPRAGFEPAQNLSSGLVEWSCAVVITTTSRGLTFVKVKRFGLVRHRWKIKKIWSVIFWKLNDPRNLRISPVMPIQSFCLSDITDQKILKNLANVFCRSSHRRCSIKILVPKKLAKVKGKQLCRSLLLQKSCRPQACNFIK